MANPKRPASKKSKPTKKPSKKQAVNPDPDRFVDAHAHELMGSTYAKRKPLYEREVILSEFWDTIIPTQFESRGWVSFLTDVVSPYENMVKEFFVNVHDIDDKSFSFYSYLRGQKFQVTPELVARIVKLPRVSHPTYPYRKSRSPSFDSIALLLFGFPRRYRGSTLDTGDFSAEYHLISRILFTHILPVSHFSTLPLKRVKFLYAFLNGDSIDLPSVICSHIISAYRSKSKKLGLPYSFDPSIPSSSDPPIPPSTDITSSSSVPPLAITLAKILNAVGTIATNSTVHAAKLQKLEENYDRTCGALRRLRKAFVKLRRSINIDREPSPSRSEESAFSDADTDADDTDAYADSSTDDAGPSSAAS
ncbi:hypothetical protein CJ030_MR7G008239 [Morella rubra]|uniref:Putative plant transposon protein domain-containing protein n=1 Tax=Morella rubra TaxID=262757 RepID=A0A6A1V2F7_9ROSI|nr:hypothetical protein CJ030_MR7G008245 [Morella rubra]KAB1206845.1 hypothetical protein CJ030_MR7G008239 [Morella rubra]